MNFVNSSVIIDQVIIELLDEITMLNCIKVKQI